MAVLDISDVSRRSSVAPSTLRYYEEKGLIRSIGRRGLHRLFEASVLDRLALIRLGQAAGFSLEEINGTFTGNGVRIDRRILNDKAEELDRTIRNLISMRDGLRHAAACSAPSHMECPTFRRLLGLTTKKAQRGHKTDGKRPQRRGPVLKRGRT